eukprot:TRINITY_DN36261_c0_g1_i1.p1 TRINITY_DN36261_c0_g1~~TRINITY_DN36261_c0_g1_i1.p1  ORF type:complete len:274 (+),score=48.15 TRINITY_DN36261_c0_g1_i1:122-943(+)
MQSLDATAPFELADNASCDGSWASMSSQPHSEDEEQWNVVEEDSPFLSAEDTGSGSDSEVSETSNNVPLHEYEICSAWEEALPDDPAERPHAEEDSLRSELAGLPQAAVLACGPMRIYHGTLDSSPAFASELPGHCADVTHEWMLAFHSFPGVTGAFCLGRLALSLRCAGASAMPHALVCAQVALRNGGAAAWPKATALRVVAGDPYGFDVMPIGPLPSGHGACLTMDLCIPSPAVQDKGVSIGCGKRSAWVLTDDLGRPFGPLLVLEIVWSE